MLDIQPPEAQFAIQAVRQATLLVKKIQSEMVTAAISKEDRSPVTVADFASQALVGKLLDEAFPNDPLVGEEDSTALQSPDEAEKLERVTAFLATALPDATPQLACQWIDRGGAQPAQRFWTVDPIDGTKGFLRGQQYVVALALIVDGQVQLGALGCPNLTDGYAQEIGGPGSLLLATRGAGTWTTSLEDSGNSFTQLHVSDRNDPCQARLLRSYEAGHTNVNQLDKIAQALGTSVEPVRLDSQAKYAILAANGGELIFRLLSPKAPDYQEKIWDQAAGSLVVTEAGGQITDLDGKALDFAAGRTLARNRGVLASNGHLHQAALAAIQASES
jgi:3'(2'), 5'-bisphosphate nucleotidase